MMQVDTIQGVVANWAGGASVYPYQKTLAIISVSGRSDKVSNGNSQGRSSNSRRRKRIRAIPRKSAAEHLAERARRKGAYFCEACGWRPPSCGINHGKLRGLDMHHIRPVAAGGTESKANLILLCPNHHRIAHMLGYSGRIGIEGPWRKWDGPETKDGLITAIREAETPPSSDLRDASLPWYIVKTRPILAQIEAERAQGDIVGLAS